MKRTRLVLIASVLLSLGCAVRTVTLPDPKIPHRVAEEAKLKVWVRNPDGSLVKQCVKIEEGWYVASPALVDP